MKFSKGIEEWERKERIVGDIVGTNKGSLFSARLLGPFCIHACCWVGVGQEAYEMRRFVKLLEPLRDLQQETFGNGAGEDDFA